MATNTSFEKRAREEAARIEGEDAAEEEGRTKRSMFNTWVAQGGGPAKFEAAWPSMRRLEQLKPRTLAADGAAREAQHHQLHSRILGR
jgi:hypothetical protein